LVHNHFKTDINHFEFHLSSFFFPLCSLTEGKEIRFSVGLTQRIDLWKIPVERTLMEAVAAVYRNGN